MILRRLFLPLALLLAIASPAIAQNTLVSATVTDVGGQAWVSGTYTFTSEAYPSIAIISGTLDANGAFTNVTFPTNNVTSRVGGRWRVRICPAVTAPCYGVSISVPGGPTLDLTSTLVPPAIAIDALKPPPITAYTDSEIVNAVQGSRYLNVTDSTEHVCKALPCSSNWQPTPSTSKLNSTIIVDGVTYPRTQVGINAAIAAAGCGGHVFLPAGTYNLTDTSSAQEILYSPSASCTQGIELNGEGGELTVLQVAANVPGTEDVIRIASTGTEYGFYLHDFYIQPISGSPARYGINFDETNGSIAHVVVARVRVGSVGNTLGNYAVFNTNTVPSCNPLYLTTFEDNTFVGGLSMINMGDSLLFTRNNITGPRDFYIQNVSTGCHGDGGSHGFQAIGNNLTPTGGTIIKNSWQGYFAFNDIEQVVNTTEANGALLDIQGAVGNKTTNFIIEGNYLGCNSLFNCVNAVRVDQAVHTIIKHNLLPRGSGAAILLTANADRTEILNNTDLPLGELITTWLSDSGTNTYVSWQDGTTGIEAHTDEAWGTSGSTARNFYLTGTQFKGSNAAVMGWATGDPTGTGSDSSLSRISAGIIGAGNGTQGNLTGSLQATGFLPNAAGAGGIGSAALPHGVVWLGTAATNNFKFQPAATGQATVISLLDPKAATSAISWQGGIPCTNGELALSAGWGTTATVTAVVGLGWSCEWTVTSSGTGQAANPTLTDTLVLPVLSASIACEMRMVGGTGTATLIDQTTLSATAPVFTFGGTPVAASTYKVYRRC